MQRRVLRHALASALLTSVAIALPGHAATAEPSVGVVSGVVHDTDGNPVTGADVQIELEPSAGYRTAGGARIHLLGEALTGAGGVFSIPVPTTDDVLAEADYLNGTVNMMVQVVYQTAQNGVWTTEVGAGGVYSQLLEYDTGDAGFTLAPVNVGVVIIADTTSGIGGLPDTPPNDPYDPNTPPDPSVPLPAGLGGVLAQVPYEEPWVDTPSVSTRWANVVALPPKLPESSAMPKPEDPPYSDPDDRCKRPINQGTWLVDKIDSEYRWQPVGEVHSVPGLKVRYHYEERASTTLGLAVSEDGSHWKVSGGTSMANDSGASTVLPWMPDTYARKVQGEFYYAHNRKTWCPVGYDERDGPYATHTEEIKAVSWQGGVRYDSEDLSGADNRDARDKAIAEGRAMTLVKGDSFSRKSGTSYKYTAGVSAFGVGLNAVSTFDTKHTLELIAGTSRQSWRAWGDKGAPPSAANHAIYVYFDVD